jgi:YbbR domain-containing protein
LFQFRTKELKVRKKEEFGKAGESMKIAKKLSEVNDRYNIWIKVLAIVISVLIWLVVVNVSDPVTSTTFSGVPVEIINEDVLTSQGKIYEMTSASTVTVTVNAKRSILDSINKDYLKAVADMNDLDEEKGTIRLKVESNKYNEKIESMKAKEDVVTVSIDNLLKRQLAISASVTGTPADGYVNGDVTMDQNIVRLSGPEQIVSQISKVVAEVSVEGMSSNVSTTVDLKLYDSEGGQISDKGISKNISSVAIVAEVLATKEVPIKVYTSGEAADGYGMTGNIDIEPATVVIAGKSSVLKNIDDITIPATEISVEGASETVEETLNLADYLSDSVRFAKTDQETEVKVAVEILAKEVQEKEITRPMITIQNMPEGYKGNFRLENNISVKLVGMPEAMAKLDDNPMTVVVDVAAYMKDKGITTLADATYEMPLTIKLPNGVELDSDKTYTVSLRVTKNEE